MLSTFCLRLACGLAAAFWLLPSSQINPRFYRVQFLSILGLTALTAATGRFQAAPWVCLALVLTCGFLGSMAWSLEGAPGGKILAAVTVFPLIAVLALPGVKPSDPIPGGREELSFPSGAAGSWPWLLAGELSSAALLGSAVTAMLMGHSYLIAPSMSLTPLLRLLAALFAAIILRMAVAGLGIGFWTSEQQRPHWTDETFWLPVRWLLGFGVPLVLSWMAWRAARIRSTQSATGILYVVVICCFLGELTGQLLASQTGFLL